MRIRLSWYHWYKRLCISLLRSSDPSNKMVKRPLRTYSIPTYTPQSTSESMGNLFTLKTQRYLKTTMRKLPAIKGGVSYLTYRNSSSLGNLHMKQNYCVRIYLCERTLYVQGHMIIEQGSQRKRKAAILYYENLSNIKVFHTHYSFGMHCLRPGIPDATASWCATISWCSNCNEPLFHARRKAPLYEPESKAELIHTPGKQDDRLHYLHTCLYGYTCKTHWYFSYAL